MQYDKGNAKVLMKDLISKKTKAFYSINIYFYA